MNLGSAIKKSDLWIKRRAVLIGDSSTTYMYLNQVLQNLGWSLHKMCKSSDEALELVKNKKAYMIIVDDTETFSAIPVIRKLISEPMMLVTPTLAFLLNHNENDLQLIDQMVHIEVMVKPLSPTRFIPVFSNLIRKWESPQFYILRQETGEFFFSTGKRDALGRLLKLYKYQDVESILASFLAHYHIKNNEIKEAEKFLLTEIHKRPQNIVCLITLIDLYLQFAMPMLAKRLLTSLISNFEGSTLILMDLIHVNLLLQNHKEAQNCYKKIVSKVFVSEKNYLGYAIILCSMGLFDEAKKLPMVNAEASKQLKISWQSYW